MAIEGRCNCMGITVKIPAMPQGSTLCYCSNCQRAGSGPCSVNYILDTPEVTIQDPNGHLKSYKDSNTKSGNTITRQFCGNCGSPVVTLLAGDSPVVILKAELFDQVGEPVKELFTESKVPWLKIARMGE